jgi:Fe-S oxidoreductase
MNGPADFLEVPVNPITGTRFEQARSTKMVHIVEFTADLIRNNKLDLTPSRNDNLKVTYHDSCNPSRGMGFFEEPRYVIQNVCNHFYDMPPGTIREQTFCCGSGAGLNAGENMELRLSGGMPRANAVKHVRDAHGVNMLACICAIDRAALPALMDYWLPGVQVAGTHELVANALNLPGQNERATNLRGEDFEELKAQAEGETDE